jgi:long-chain fatty acid transport protein
MDAFGFQSRESAMGSAGVASTSPVAANYYNPAGIVRARALEIDLGYMHADHHLTTNGVDNHVDPVSGLVGGIAAPGRFLGIPLAFGLGIHLPDDRISRVRALPQTEPRWELYDNRNQRLFLSTSLAVRPLKFLTIGAGLAYMSSTTGSLDITGSANIFNGTESQIRNQVNADLTAIDYPQAGIQLDLGKNVRLGAAYRGQFKLRLDLSATLQGDVSHLTTLLYDLETHSVNNFQPQQFVFGGSWKPMPSTTIAFDATWINYAAYESPVADLRAKLDIPPPAGGWPAGITPPSAPAPTAIVPLVMHDRIVPHLGVETRAFGVRGVELFLRGGFEYQKSPIAEQTGITNFIDRDKYAVSFGFGARAHDLLPELPKVLTLDAHMTQIILANAVTHKTDPSDLVGDYRASGQILVLGATLGMQFFGDGRRE